MELSVRRLFLPGGTYGGGPQLFESTLGYALLGFGQKKNSSIFTTLEFLVGAGGLRKPRI